MDPFATGRSKAPYATQQTDPTQPAAARNWLVNEKALGFFPGEHVPEYLRTWPRGMFGEKRMVSWWAIPQSDGFTERGVDQDVVLIFTLIFLSTLFATMMQPCDVTPSHSELGKSTDDAGSFSRWYHYRSDNFEASVLERVLHGLSTSGRSRLVLLVLGNSENAEAQKPAAFSRVTMCLDPSHQQSPNETEGKPRTKSRIASSTVSVCKGH
jgi:hypothetical protein